MPETTKQPDREIGAEEDFGALFERSLKQPKQGEVVTGRVVLVGRDAVTIDIGYKSEGTIPIHEFTTREGELTVHEGDEVDVYFEASDTESGDIEVDVDRKSTRLNSSHRCISYAVFCLKKKKK